MEMEMEKIFFFFSGMEMLGIFCSCVKLEIEVMRAVEMEMVFSKFVFAFSGLEIMYSVLLEVKNESETALSVPLSLLAFLLFSALEPCMVKSSILRL